MTEKHNVFKNRAAAQALADELEQNPDYEGKVTLIKVDRFIVNDFRTTTEIPQNICDWRAGPYYIVSVIA